MDGVRSRDASAGRSDKCLVLGRAQGESTSLKGRQVDAPEHGRQCVGGATGFWHSRNARMHGARRSRSIVCDHRTDTSSRGVNDPETGSGTARGPGQGVVHASVPCTFPTRRGRAAQNAARQSPPTTPVGHCASSRWLSWPFGVTLDAIGTRPSFGSWGAVVQRRAVDRGVKHARGSRPRSRPPSQRAPRPDRAALRRGSDAGRHTVERGSRHGRIRSPNHPQAQSKPVARRHARPLVAIADRRS